MGSQWFNCNNSECIKGVIKPQLSNPVDHIKNTAANRQEALSIKEENKIQVVILLVIKLAAITENIF